MANGYYRASGRLAPLVTIPGPGFTWALTALAEALQDSAALVHLVGRAPSPDHRLHLQAIDQLAVATPLVKGTFCLEEPQHVQAEVRKAMSLALAGEPGPVLVEWTREALESAAPSTVATDSVAPCATSSADIGEVV